MTRPLVGLPWNLPSAMPPLVCPLGFCLFSIVFRSVSLASLGFAAGDAEKTELKYPFAGAGAVAAAAAAGAGGDFFLSSMWWFRR